jgi:hypothetical protein
MKGKYMTTSLLLAALAGRKTVNLVHLPETIASVTDQQLIWSKSIASAKQAVKNMADRDELKMA